MSDPIFTIRSLNGVHEGKYFFVDSCTTGENVSCWRTDIVPIDDQKTGKKTMSEVSDETTI